jgi:hypothetical protein
MPVHGNGDTYKSPCPYDVLHCDQYPASRYVYGFKRGNGYLDRKECLVCISWVSLEEAREKLEISAWGVDSIKFPYLWGTGLRVWYKIATVAYAPLLRNIFVPGGRLSMPALRAANASSSEIGGSRQLKGRTH